MTDIDAFIPIFQLPATMWPYLNLIVTEQEIDLVVGLAQEPLPGEKIAEMLRIPQDEADHLVRDAYERDVIKRVLEDHQDRFAPGQFYANLDYLSAYETGTWRKVPGNVRSKTAQWQLKQFIEMWKPAIEAVAQDPDAWANIKNRDVLLL